jgi:CRISPR-associated protein Cmr2
MSGYLLLITLGPIQDFIAEARRTRDLWFGSRALSELSRAAATAVTDAGGKLIFPALDKGNIELEPCNEPIRRDTQQPPLPIANKIQATVDNHPKEVAEAARHAVMKRWRNIARTVKGKVADCLEKGIDGIWDEQVDTLIEYYATWAPLAPGYAEARTLVEQAVAGRKNLRDFTQWHQPRKGAPKSSLDGARVSVLSDDRKTKAADFAKYRISSGEQLSAVDLVKRAGFNPDQFVPIMNIAAAPWLANVGPHINAELVELGNQCKKVHINSVHRPDLPVGRLFTYDASVFYPDRWASLFDELNEPQDSNKKPIDHREWGRVNVTDPILKKLKELNLTSQPSAYVVCLAADGDRMGKVLEDLSKRKDDEGIRAHQDFSRDLSKFAVKAREIVESKDHLGSLVYAGGDDVLAFLPVATAIPCAQVLQTAFTELIKEALIGKNVSVTPTLSVGIGIGHVMEAMSTLLDLGREAEKAAKNAGRNALAIVIDKRSGGKRMWAASWSDKPAERLARDIRLFKDELATGKVYEIGAMLRRFEKVADADADKSMLDAFVSGILVQSGRESAGKKVTLASLRPSIHGGTATGLECRLAQLRKMSDRLLIAKELRANGWRDAPAGDAP